MFVVGRVEREEVEHEVEVATHIYLVRPVLLAQELVASAALHIDLQHWRASLRQEVLESNETAVLAWGVRLTLRATVSTFWPRLQVLQVLRVQTEEARSRTDLCAQGRAVDTEHMDPKDAGVTFELAEAKEEQKVDFGARAVAEKQ